VPITRDRNGSLKPIDVRRILRQIETLR
jgi:hypothetical protein